MVVIIIILVIVVIVVTVVINSDCSPATGKALRLDASLIRMFRVESPNDCFKRNSQTV